eukprot:634585-Hanusia_phi.AAC.2
MEQQEADVPYEVDIFPPSPPLPPLPSPPVVSFLSPPLRFPLACSPFPCSSSSHLRQIAWVDQGSGSDAMDIAKSQIMPIEHVLLWRLNYGEERRWRDERGRGGEEREEESEVQRRK